MRGFGYSDLTGRKLVSYKSWPVTRGFDYSDLTGRNLVT